MKKKKMMMMMNVKICCAECLIKEEANAEMMRDHHDDGKESEDIHR